MQRDPVEGFKKILLVGSSNPNESPETLARVHELILASALAIWQYVDRSDVGVAIEMQQTASTEDAARESNCMAAALGDFAKLHGFPNPAGRVIDLASVMFLSEQSRRYQAERRVWYREHFERAAEAAQLQPPADVPKLKPYATLVCMVYVEGLLRTTTGEKFAALLGGK